MNSKKTGGDFDNPELEKKKEAMSWEERKNLGFDWA